MKNPRWPPKLKINDIYTVTSLVPLGAQNEVEIALSLTVSEIQAIFRFSRFRRISKSPRWPPKMKIHHIYTVTFLLPLGAQNEVEIALSLTVSEIQVIFRVSRFRRFSKNPRWPPKMKIHNIYSYFLSTPRGPKWGQNRSISYRFRDTGYFSSFAI